MNPAARVYSNRLAGDIRDQIHAFASSFDGEGHPLSDRLGALGNRIATEADANRPYDLSRDDVRLLRETIADLRKNDPDALNDAFTQRELLDPIRSARGYWRQQDVGRGALVQAEVMPEAEAGTWQTMRDAFGDAPPADPSGAVVDVVPINPASERVLKDAAAISPDGAPPTDTPMAGSPSMRAQMQAKLQELHDAYSKVPEFIREDLLEGLLVGGGIAVPVALTGEQDFSEQAATVLGGIGAATLGGAAARRIGARIGARYGDQPLEPGTARYNLARILGRKDNADVMLDMSGVGDVPTLRNEDFGRALGRAIGDEAFGVAGAIGGLAAAQALDSTPDAVPQPTLGEVTLATVPGAAIGLATSGLFGSLVDTVGMNREVNTNPDADPWEVMQRSSVFGRRKATT